MIRKDVKALGGEKTGGKDLCRDGANG